MKVRPRRHAHRVGPIRINRNGLTITSVTINLGLWRGILWERAK